MAQEPTPTPTPTPTDTASTWLTAKFGQEVRDASDLLAFAVSRGLPVEDETVAAIKDGEQLLVSETLPEPAIRGEFEKAYRALAQKLSPVTIETLRATDDNCGRRVWLLGLKPLSEGRLWSRKLWLATVLFLVFIIIGESIEGIVNQPNFAVDDESGRSLLGMSLATWQLLAGVVGQLVPFAYGGLGACASLLRSVHTFVYERTFDRNRRPVYGPHPTGFVERGRDSALHRSRGQCRSDRCRRACVSDWIQHGVLVRDDRAPCTSPPSERLGCGGGKADNGKASSGSGVA